ncbi:hypothetical protein [Nocardiopsis suaedae]|uniref:Uncharacterized protein n=1 Tax=Nocardiopsis suaedae TaxID=3018444 RepID=A0ABT4TGX8_9ACTN|nr:hypothetical protein [Nocardiopsis suaedae]MDA2803645.1 hypothetical protein [Nocardiopsis suaedae]
MALPATPRTSLGTPVYEQALRSIAALPLQDSAPVRLANLDLVRHLAAPGPVLRLLREVLDTPPLLARIAGRSYHHTNHFDKIVLADSGARRCYRLTLHLWRPPYSTEEALDEQIHDHRFSFWSSVLTGRLDSQNFVRDASGDDYGEYQYIPEKRGEATVGNFYRSMGRTPLRETAPSCEEAGGSYRLGYHRIHRVVLPRDEMTCTLVLRGPRQKNFASVFSNTATYDPTANDMFPPHVLAEKLEALCAEITRTRKADR